MLIVVLLVVYCYYNNKYHHNTNLIGCQPLDNDVEIADYVGLTTLSQHLKESSQVAIEMLLARLADPDRPIQHVRLPLTIVKRETA